MTALMKKAFVNTGKKKKGYMTLPHQKQKMIQFNYPRTTP